VYSWQEAASDYRLQCTATLEACFPAYSCQTDNLRLSCNDRQQQQNKLSTSETKLICVAQCSGRRSLAGGLSLIYAWSMVDVWPLCG